jgi:hypothetical protein
VTWPQRTIRVSSCSTSAIEPYVEELGEEKREVVASTLARYRHPDRLREGDQLPALAALTLEDGTRVELRDLALERPLLLIFGSFT